MLQSKRVLVLVVLFVAAIPVLAGAIILAGALAVTPVRTVSEAGEASAQVDTAPIVIEDVPQLDPAPAQEESAANLPQPSAGEALYVNEAEGYALLYPADFTVAEPEAHIVVVSGPDEFPGPEPSRGFVNIDSTRVGEGQSAVAFSDEVVAPFMPFTEDLWIERTDHILGGEPAVEIIGVPGQNLSWQVVAVHNDTLYLLTFSPLGEENGQAFVDMQAIYQIVMRSFTFID